MGFYKNEMQRRTGELQMKIRGGQATHLSTFEELDNVFKEVLWLAECVDNMEEFFSTFFNLRAGLPSEVYHENMKEDYISKEFIGTDILDIIKDEDRDIEETLYDIEMYMRGLSPYLEDY